MSYEPEIDEIPELGGNDDSDTDDDENSVAKLLKKKPNKKDTKAKNQRKEPHKFGSRMLQLSLFDGHIDAIAIEYMPIPALNSEMVGCKILLIGPFDVRVGTILLRTQNIKVISNITHIPNNNTAVPTGQNLPNPSRLGDVNNIANLAINNTLHPRFDSAQLNTLLIDCENELDDSMEF